MFDWAYVYFDSSSKQSPFVQNVHASINNSPVSITTVVRMYEQCKILEHNTLSADRKYYEVGSARSPEY